MELNSTVMKIEINQEYLKKLKELYNKRDVIIDKFGKIENESNDDECMSDISIKKIDEIYDMFRNALAEKKVDYDRG